MSESGGSTPAVGIVTAAMAAFARGDFDGMSAFVHPEAEIEVLGLDGQVVRGVQGLRDALAAAERRSHEPSMSSIEPIGDDGAMMIGRVRYGDASGARWDSPAVWLTIVRDEKVWRSRAYTSVDEARAAYPTLAS
jgi:ketosteroid isomerase-like protein